MRRSRRSGRRTRTAGTPSRPGSGITRVTPTTSARCSSGGACSSSPCPSSRGGVRRGGRAGVHHPAPPLRERYPAARAKRRGQVRRRPRLPRIQATDEHPRAAATSQLASAALAAAPRLPDERETLSTVRWKNASSSAWVMPTTAGRVVSGRTRRRITSIAHQIDVEHESAGAAPIDPVLSAGQAAASQCKADKRAHSGSQRGSHEGLIIPVRLRGAVRATPGRLRSRGSHTVRPSRAFADALMTQKTNLRGYRRTIAAVAGTGGRPLLSGGTSPTA